MRVRCLVFSFVTAAVAAAASFDPGGHATATVAFLVGAAAVSYTLLDGILP